MRLYGYYRSSTSYRVRIGLNLKGFEYDQVAVNLKDGEQYSQSHAQVNPFRKVPVLEVDGVRRVQSLAILEWLDEVRVAPPFMPKDVEARRVCRELAYPIITEAQAPNNSAVLEYLRQEFNADGEAIKAWAQTWVDRVFSPLEVRLKAWDWVSQDLPFGAPTLFEIALIPQIYNAERFGAEMTRYPQLAAINAHCATLEAFARAHPDQQPDAPPA